MDRNTPEYQRYDKLGPKIAENLISHHFDAYYVKSTEEAKSLALSLVKNGDVISFGGSMTVNALGIISELKKTHKVLDRADAKTREESDEILRYALLSDTYFLGANAISEDGTLVNIDGNGNRVAALIFGPRSVIVIAGMNKVTKDVASAHIRAHTIAAPTNSQRFPIETPCKIDGTCHSCHSLACICNHIVETRNSRPKGRIKVILVGENLGM